MNADSPSSLFQQAINDQQQGKKKAALSTLKKLLNHHPDYDEAYQLLLHLYSTAPGEVIPTLKGHLESHPETMQCYDYLRYAYVLADEIDELTLYLNTLFIRFPKSAKPLYQLAEIYDGKGNMQLAKEYINDALQREPNNWRCKNLLASIQIKEGATEAAERHYRESLTYHPDNPVAISGLAEIDYAKKEYQKAYNSLITYVDNHANRDPNILKSFIKSALKVGQGHLAIKKAEEYLSNHSGMLRDGATISLYGDLAKIYDRKGAYKKAFKLMRRCNEMSGSHWNAQQEENEIAFAKKHYNLRLLTQKIPIISTRPSPIFIIGFPRSGTTLVEQIISSHPEVLGAGELPAMSHINRYMVNGANSPEIYQKFISSLPQNSQAREQLITHYLTDAQSQNPIDKPFYTDKMPINFMHIGLIRVLFPQAPIIHCKRNPKDTCISCYFQQFSEAHSYSNNLKTLGKAYNLYLEMMAHWNACGINMFEVEYEALIAHQERISRAIISHCQLSWDKQCLKPHEQDRFIATASAEQVSRVIYDTSIDRWKNYQNEITPLVDELCAGPDSHD